MRMNEQMKRKMEHEKRHHVPPHKRRGVMGIEFEERDLEVLNEVFGDADTASTAADIILNSPPEIQILAVQIIKMIEEEA